MGKSELKTEVWLAAFGGFLLPAAVFSILPWKQHMPWFGIAAVLGLPSAGLAALLWIFIRSR